MYLAGTFVEKEHIYNRHGFQRQRSASLTPPTQRPSDMRTKIALLCVMALWASTSQAQLRKCVGADGKVTYSDTGCATEKKETGVRGGTVNTMESAGLRQYAAQSKAPVATRLSVQVVGSSPSSASQSSQSGYWKCE